MARRRAIGGSVSFGVLVGEVSCPDSGLGSDDPRRFKPRPVSANYDRETATDRRGCSGNASRRIRKSPSRSGCAVRWDNRAARILKIASAFSRRRNSTADSGDLRLHRPVQGPVRVEPIWRVLELVRKRMLLLNHASDNRIQPPGHGLRNAARRLEPRLRVGQAVRSGRRPVSRMCDRTTYRVQRPPYGYRTAAPRRAPDRPGWKSTNRRPTSSAGSSTTPWPAAAPPGKSSGDWPPTGSPPRPTGGRSGAPPPSVGCSATRPTSVGCTSTAPKPAPVSKKGHRQIVRPGRVGRHPGAADH